MTSPDLSRRIRELAAEQGFTLCGIAPARPSADFESLVGWVEAGYAGEMTFFAERLEAYRDPASVLVGVASVVALAYPYPAADRPPVPGGRGQVARYASTGNDYHDRIHRKLKRVIAAITAGNSSDRPRGGAGARTGPMTAECPPRVRGVVDTAPLLEREIAQLAGLGWRGKNTLLLRPGWGSYFFLACLLIDRPLPPDPPFDSFHCGTCTACLDACPTHAFPQPGVLDARRCISYLTIEHRGAIPRELRSSIGDWLFGCDICQEVCPWNRKPARLADAAIAAEESSAPPLGSLDLPSLFELDDEAFRARFRKTALWRARRRGILRNAAIVLGNQRDRAAEPALRSGLADAEAIVRGAAAWALGELRSPTATAALRQRLLIENDPDVRREIEAALSLTADAG